MKSYLTQAFTSIGFYLITSSVEEGYHILDKREADNLYTNYKSEFVDIHGSRIHYRDEGEGFPLVMLHGFSASLHLWDDWAHSPLADQYRLIRMDLPGFGLSDLPPKSKLAFNYYLEYILILLDKLGVKQCYLVGNSFGGWLTWELALRYPEIVKGVVLVSSAGYFTSRTKPKTVEFVKKPVFKQLLKTGIPRFLIKRILANSYGDKNKITEYDINRYYGLANREGNLLSLVKIASIEVNAKPKLIKKIKQPTLIMWGTEDRVIPVTDAFKFHKDIPNSELVVYKGAGHIPQVEEANKTIKDVQAFLNKL